MGKAMTTERQFSVGVPEGSCWAYFDTFEEALEFCRARQGNRWQPFAGPFGPDADDCGDGLTEDQAHQRDIMLGLATSDAETGEVHGPCHDIAGAVAERCYVCLDSYELCDQCGGFDGEHESHCAAFEMSDADYDSHARGAAHLWAVTAPGVR